MEDKKKLFKLLSIVLAAIIVFILFILLIVYVILPLFGDDYEKPKIVEKPTSYTLNSVTSKLADYADTYPVIKLNDDGKIDKKYSSAPKADDVVVVELKLSNPNYDIFVDSLFSYNNNLVNQRSLYINGIRLDSTKNSIAFHSPDSVVSGLYFKDQIVKFIRSRPKGKENDNSLLPNAIVYYKLPKNLKSTQMVSFGIDKDGKLY